jgi:hypothetical protein
MGLAFYKFPFAHQLSFGVRVLEYIAVSICHRSPGAESVLGVFGRSQPWTEDRMSERTTLL